MPKPSPRTPRRFAPRWLIALAGLAAPLIASAQQADPIYWGQPSLEIPYRWNGAAGGSQVVLYYSADRGRTWPRAASALPHVRSFRFQAPGDGEYWFTTRTYDSLGRATPATPLGPEMRVIVDTASPVIDAIHAELVDGRLSVDLKASDTAGLSDEAIHLYAQPAGQAGWVPVPLVANQPSVDRRSLRLTAEWQAPAAARSVTVRATLEDLAGNRVEKTATATATASRAIASRSFGEDFSYTPSRSVAWPSKPTGPVDPFAAAELRSASPPRSPSPRRPVEPPSTPWPAERDATRPLIAAAPAAPSSQFSSASFRSTPLDPFDSGFSGNQTPASRPGRLVNSTEFEFDYELDRTGRWGVAKVELWGTDNNGRSWRRFAIDSDRQSPIHVSTPGEGEYGFRLVVESIGGLEATTPRPGDQPEATVGVDLTLPRVQLTGTRQGVGYFADQLIIEWQADDRHLSEKPIDLYYSNRATGPWIPIATNLPNSGRHSWRLQRHLPRQMHVRIEARDEAGNVAAATTLDALAIDVATASGSLRGVRPSGG